MSSRIGWLDASRDEQRRMREIIKLFEDRESREELGLSQIRDGLSDGLFPGTSTLHTRARYLLFIPWSFQRAAERHGTLSTEEAEERQLINALRKVNPHPRGIIGGDVGGNVKTLPSSIYWSALRTYGIHTGVTNGRADSVSLDTSPVWRAGIPECPSGFPTSVPDGFDLSREEAIWLRERITDAGPDSLMAHLLADLVSTPLSADSITPWEDAAALNAGTSTAVLDHARLCSNVIHGAQLLYNILIAESYEHFGFDRVANPVATYTQRFDDWAAGIADRSDVRAWDLREFFALLTRTRGSRVGSKTEAFVQRWHQLCLTHQPAELRELPEARTLVTYRERSLKGPMARIGNPSRLKHWGGGSGAGQYTYRWSYVKTILNDIRAGLIREEPTSV